MLVWFLAIAVPVQGVSAATMLACAGHRSHLGASADPHSHRAAPAHHPHLQGSSADPFTHAGVDHSKSDKTERAKEAGHKRSACASCCLNAVVATEAVSFGRVDLPELFAPLVARAPAPFVTEGPERPPRTFLA